MSQSEHPHADIGCGVASTMMLLKYHYHAKPLPTYATLCKRLRILLPSEKKGKGEQGVLGVYVEDVVRYLKASAIRFSMTNEATERRVRQLISVLRRSPVMAEMNLNRKQWGPYGHWIVLDGFRQGRFTYLNPLFKTRSRKRRQ